MFRIFCIQVFFAFLLTGCMHSRILTDGTPPDSLARINLELGNRAGHLDLLDSTRIEANRFVFDAESTFCFVKHRDQPRVFPNSDIRHVVVPDRMKGALEGLGYGALPGAIIGGAVGLLVGVGNSQARSSGKYVPPDSTHPGYYEYHDLNLMTPLEGLALGAAIGAVPGAVLGLYMGVVGGSILEVRYQFPVKAKAPKP
jgi:hypothetical protein